MNVRRIATTAALTATAALALASCGGATLDIPTSSVPAGSANEMTVTGTLTLHRDADDYKSSRSFTTTGNYCAGKGGYSDITSGAAVTVYDAAGTIIGAGGLGAGVADTTTNGTTHLSPTNDTCAFPFTVEHVPTGSAFYQYEISHRGRLTFTAAEAPFLAADLNND